MDLTEGNVGKKVILFSLPLLGSLLLQYLFHTADMAVVGRYSTHQALAAVGATSPLISLLLNLLVGISMGTCVVCANAFGAGDRRLLDKVIHTSMLFSLVAGFLLGAAGCLWTEPLLRWMDTPEDVMAGAKAYMQIFFVGMPCLQVYNFGAALLRGVGDTRRPFYYLVVSGILNVALNLFFVICMNMAVEGVAIATVISEGLSAILVWIALKNTGDGICLQWRRLSIHRGILAKILVIGVPAGIQGACFSFSNVVIQTAINSFGSLGVAGCTAGLIWEELAWTASYGFNQVATSFVGQNLGAGKWDRIRQSIWWCVFLGSLSPAFMGLAFFLFARPLLEMFLSSPDAIPWGYERMQIVLTTYAILGAMDAVSGSIRGLGRTVAITVIMLLGVCGLRVLWVHTVFPLKPTVTVLFTVYPISWAAALIPMAFYLCYLMKKKPRLTL